MKKGKIKMNEIWKEVVGFQGLYQVSDFGRVKSLNYRNTRQQKILKDIIGPHKHNNRIYKQHYVHLSNGVERKQYFVSRLGWQAFNGLIPNGYEIDHINNNPQDNRLENLQCITKSQNNRKRFIDNKELSVKVKCINNNVIYNSISEAGRQLKLNTGNICKLLKGRCNNTCGYKFQRVNQ